jgi:glutathione peroxidase
MGYSLLVTSAAMAAVLICTASSVAQEGKKPPGAAGQESKKPAAADSGKSVYDFTAKNIDGKDVKLSSYSGDVLLIVNVASRCGYTEGHYKQLEPLYRKYKDKGLRILAFPCNDFGAQEPGTAGEIKAFCTAKYDVTFDLFDKISVKGDKKHPLYEYLTKHPNKDIAGEITWNFNKFLVGRDGQVIARFDSKVPPNDPKLIDALEKALKTPKPASSGKAK